MVPTQPIEPVAPEPLPPGRPPRRARPVSGVAVFGYLLALAAVSFSLGFWVGTMRGERSVDRIARRIASEIRCGERPGEDPGPGVAPAAAARVPVTSPEPPIEMDPARRGTVFKFETCTHEVVRDETGAFRRQRLVPPARVLRPGTAKLMVIEHYACKPCKKLIEDLGDVDLQGGIDLIVLGVGVETPANHEAVFSALGTRPGWVYIGGVDPDRLLGPLFPPDGARYPTTLILDPDNRIVGGVQSSSTRDTIEWALAELAVVRPAGLDPQPVASLNPEYQAGTACPGPGPPAASRPGVSAGPAPPPPETAVDEPGPPGFFPFRGTNPATPPPQAKDVPAAAPPPAETGKTKPAPAGKPGKGKQPAGKTKKGK